MKKLIPPFVTVFTSACAVVACVLALYGAMTVTGCSVAGKSDGTLEGSASLEYPSFLSADEAPASQPTTGG